MTHEYEYKFASPDQGCEVICFIEYSAEPAEYCGDYVITGQLHNIDVRASRIIGYDLDGNEVYTLTADDLTEGWLEALDAIADTAVQAALDDGCSCLGECLWENAGYLV